MHTLVYHCLVSHGWPFGNIADGCNFFVAINALLTLSDYVVPDAGVVADVGAEKFLHIKCRKSNLKPSVLVLVALGNLNFLQEVLMAHAIVSVLVCLYVIFFNKRKFTDAIEAG